MSPRAYAENILLNEWLLILGGAQKIAAPPDRPACSLELRIGQERRLPVELALDLGSPWYLPGQRANACAIASSCEG